MASEAFEQIRQMMLSMPRLPDLPVEEQRAMGEGWGALTGELPGCGFEPVDAGGVPAEWVTPTAADRNAVILYLHGGGYAIGSISSHRKFAGHLANAARCRALIVDYRLAPEHPHPAAVEDATTAYRWLLAQGYPPDAIAIAGDSAGGGLTMAALVALRDAGEPLPAAAVPLSPWVDLEGTGESMRTRAELDPIVTETGLKEMADWYVAGGDPRHPLVSPLHADLAGLPPLLVQVGDHETLLDDSVRLAERAKKAGVDVTLEVWPEMTHVFQLGAGTYPEADEAVARIGEWLSPRLRR